MPDACCKLAIVAVAVAVLSDVELPAPEYVVVADMYGRSSEEALEPALVEILAAAEA